MTTIKMNDDISIRIDIGISITGEPIKELALMSNEQYLIFYLGNFQEAKNIADLIYEIVEDKSRFVSELKQPM